MLRKFDSGREKVCNRVARTDGSTENCETSAERLSYRGTCVSGAGGGATTPVVSNVADILRQARQEISDFQKAGGKNTDPGHPVENGHRNSGSGVIRHRAPLMRPRLSPRPCACWSTPTASPGTGAG